jgi:hypothetical protein
MSGLFSEVKVMNANTSRAIGVIDIRITNSEQLFSTLDPSPFRSRDLDSDAEEYIVASARELPKNAKVRMRIHLGDRGRSSLGEAEISEGIANYFRYRAQITAAELSELFRLGWRYLAIGAPILVVCLIASQSFASAGRVAAFDRVIEESLIIVGWVANWKPIEVFLYDWQPLRRRLKLYERLSNAEVSFAGY